MSTMNNRRRPEQGVDPEGLDDKILALYAGGMTVRDISGHLSELYGTEIGRDSVSRITDAVLEDIAAWRTRPLEQVYPIVYFDAMMVRVREDRSVQNRAATSRSGSIATATGRSSGSGGKRPRAPSSGWRSSTTSGAAASKTCSSAASTASRASPKRSKRPSRRLGSRPASCT
jgi:hypothetical protein